MNGPRPGVRSENVDGGIMECIDDKCSSEHSRRAEI
jgi:hypothetical protein